MPVDPLVLLSFCSPFGSSALVIFVALFVGKLVVVAIFAIKVYTFGVLVVDFEIFVAIFVGKIFVVAILVIKVYTVGVLAVAFEIFVAILAPKDRHTPRSAPPTA